MLQLTDEMKAAINSALADRVPLMLASISADGQPQLGLRGSVHTIDDDKLGVWLRNAEGDTSANVAQNPRVSLFYRNPETRLAMQIQGRAVRPTDPAVVASIYDGSAEPERNADPERKGTGLIIEIDRVYQRGAVVLSRD